MAGQLAIYVKALERLKPGFFEVVLSYSINSVLPLASVVNSSALAKSFVFST